MNKVIRRTTLWIAAACLSTGSVLHAGPSAGTGKASGASFSPEAAAGVIQSYFAGASDLASMGGVLSYLSGLDPEAIASAGLKPVRDQVVEAVGRTVTEDPYFSDLLAKETAASIADRARRKARSPAMDAQHERQATRFALLNGKLRPFVTDSYQRDWVNRMSTVYRHILSVEKMQALGDQIAKALSGLSAEADTTSVAAGASAKRIPPEGQLQPAHPSAFISVAQIQELEDYVDHGYSAEYAVQTLAHVLLNDSRREIRLAVVMALGNIQPRPVHGWRLEEALGRIAHERTYLDVLKWMRLSTDDPAELAAIDKLLDRLRDM